MTVPAIPAFLLSPYVTEKGFYVIGGEFKTNDWINLAGQPEIFGPFSDEKSANDKWRAVTGLSVDNCLIRYFVVHHG